MLHAHIQPRNLYSSTHVWDVIQSCQGLHIDSLDSLRGNHSNRCLIEQTRPHGTVELRGCLFGSLSLQMTMQIRRETPSVSSWKRKTNCSLLYFLSHAKTFCCSQPVAASLPGMPLHCHRKSEQRQTSLFVTTHHFSHYNTYSVSSILLPPQGLP